MNMKLDYKQAMLEIEELKLRAQIRAVSNYRKLMSNKHAPGHISQLDCVYYILLAAGTPLHVTEIIKIAKESYDMKLNSNSLVSSLRKKAVEQDTFVKTGKSTFGLVELQEE